MHFILECIDKPDSLDLRMATRPPHLEYLTSLSDKITIAGPILSEEGKPVGSLLILDVVDKAEVEAIAAGDPYAKAGLFASVTIRPFRKVLPA